jgi:hypothetical protein
MKWLRENSLDIIIWCVLLTIIFSAYAIYNLTPEYEMKRTVITLPAEEVKVLAAVDGTSSGHYGIIINSD